MWQEVVMKIYNGSIHKREELNQLPLYEQSLWEQSARQVIKNSKIFNFTVEY